MNWIYDESTDYSRLMVGYDRYGITIRQWSDDCDESKYHVSEGYFTWDQWRKRKRCYAMDNGGGRMKNRIVAGAISLLAYFGGSSDNSGFVDSLDQYVNGHHRFPC